MTFGSGFQHKQGLMNLKDITVVIPGPDLSAPIHHHERGWLYPIDFSPQTTGETTMDIKRISETLTEIDGKIRIERGPARRREVATAELLGEATASHYHLPRTEKVDDPETGKKVQVTIFAKDALGKDIVEGQPFDFIDWKGEYNTFYVYLKDEEGLWQPQGAHDAEDAAMSQAVTLAAEGSA